MSAANQDRREQTNNKHSTDKVSRLQQHSVPVMMFYDTVYCITYRPKDAVTFSVLMQQCFVILCLFDNSLKEFWPLASKILITALSTVIRRG